MRIAGNFARYQRFSLLYYFPFLYNLILCYHYFYTGTFEPNKETKLSAEVQGKINAIYVDAGSNVKKGQALIKLDDALLNQQLNTVNVQIQNITSEVDIQLQANQIQINGLEDDVRRYKILVAADAIQGIQLEKAELQLFQVLFGIFGMPELNIK